MKHEIKEINTNVIDEVEFDCFSNLEQSFSDLNESDCSNNTNDIEKKIDFSVHNQDELSSFRERFINECCEATFLNRDEAIMILLHYKWDVSKLGQEWFNDVDNNRINFGIDLPYKARENIQQQKMNKFYSCLICFSNKLFDTSLHLKCMHKFCDYCLRNYFKSKLDDDLDALYTTCPQKGCNIRIPESFFLTFFQNDNENKLRYENIIRKNFSFQNSSIKFCPKNCGRFIFSDVHYANKEITCVCQHVYCFSCLREGHR